MFTRMPIRKNCDVSRVEELCGILIDGRAETLGDEIKAQVGSGYIEKETYKRLSKWVNPEQPRPDEQPIAEAISCELFGVRISRV